MALRQWLHFRIDLGFKHHFLLVEWIPQVITVNLSSLQIVDIAEEAL